MCHIVWFILSQRFTFSHFYNILVKNVRGTEKPHYYELTALTLFINHKPHLSNDIQGVRRQWIETPNGSLNL